MAESAHELSIRQYWREVWSDGNLEAAADVYAPMFRLNGEATTVKEFRAGAESWRSHFPDFDVEVDKLFVCGDVVVSRVIYRGTHPGDFRTVPASGKTIEVSGIDIFAFEEDGVVDHWHETNHLVMFDQLGAEVRPA